MKTFDEFITEGKKKDAERQRLISAYHRGAQEGSMSADENLTPSMTIKQVLKNSGGRAMRKHLDAKKNRMDAGIEGIMKRRREEKKPR